MEKSSPSKLAETRALVAQLGLSYKVMDQMLDLIDAFSIELYAVRQDQKRLIENYRQLAQENALLRKQYAEVLYKLHELMCK